MSKFRPGVRELYPAIHATFVTRRNAPSDGFLFFWGPEDPESLDWALALRRSGLCGIRLTMLNAAEARLILPAKDGRYKIETVQGRSLSMGDAIEVLGTASYFTRQSELVRRYAHVCHSLIAWSYAAKYALELIARQCFHPSLKTNIHNLYATWQAAIESSVDISRLRQLAAMMPVCAHALYSVPHNRNMDRSGKPGMRRRRPTMMWHPEALLRSFIDAAIDAFIRRIMAQPDAMAEVAPVLRKLYEQPHPVPSMPLDELLKQDYGLDLSALREQAQQAAMQYLDNVQDDDDS